MSKETKLLRTMFSWQEEKRSALLCVRCRNQKQAIQEPVKDILFTRKDFLREPRTKQPSRRRSPKSRARRLLLAGARRPFLSTRRAPVAPAMCSCATAVLSETIARRERALHRSRSAAHVCGESFP